MVQNSPVRWHLNDDETKQHLDIGSCRKLRHLWRYGDLGLEMVPAFLMTVAK